MEAHAKEVAELLKVLANENRLMILCCLLECPMNVGQLHGRIPSITQSALSQHLSVLKANRMVEFQKTGQTITYSILDGRIGLVMEVLRENYCPDL